MRLIAVIILFAWVGTLSSNPVALDYAAYRETGDTSLLEFSMGVRRSALHYFQGNQLEVCHFFWKLEIFQDSKLIADLKIAQTDSISRQESIRPHQWLLEKTSIKLQAGIYECRLAIEDETNPNTGSLLQTVTVPDYGKDSLSVSTLNVNIHLQTQSSPDKFTRYHYRLIPNPFHVFAIEYPLIYTYMEIYNLPQQSKNYEITYLLVDLATQSKRQIEQKLKPIVEETQLETLGYNLLGLKSGHYRLIVEVKIVGEDTQSRTQHTDFTFIKGPWQEDPDNLAYIDPMPFDSMAEPALDTLFRRMHILLNREQIKAYESLTERGKRSFIKEFWRLRDPDRSTPDNEDFQSFKDKLAYCEQHFKETEKNDASADRCRIYFQYGPPDEIERSQRIANNRAYEIWHYFQPGGIFFVFMDVWGFDSYQLVHSNAPGEFHNPDWEQQYLDSQQRE